jgi:hypothetical protein
MSEIFIGFMTALWLFLMMVTSVKMLKNRLQETLDTMRMDEEIFVKEDRSRDEFWVDILEIISNDEQLLELREPQTTSPGRKYIRV